MPFPDCAAPRCPELGTVSVPAEPWVLWCPVHAVIASAHPQATTAMLDAEAARASRITRCPTHGVPLDRYGDGCRRCEIAIARREERVS